MNNPGSYTLAALPITAALSAVAQTPIEDLDGILAATLECRFQWGSGGTTCVVRVQTSLDGTNWLDVARFDFTTAAAVKVANLSGLLSKAIAAYQALTVEGVNDGILGAQWRAEITSTGTYANTTVGVRLAAR